MSHRAARASVVLCAFALVVTAACGSRVKGGGSGDQGLSGTTGSESSATTSGGTDGTTATPAADKVGTLDNPCGGDKPSGSIPSGTPGVTDSSIKIGVISDKKNDITPVPTVGIEEAVKAFVDFCNSSGGVNGRTLELKTYDAGIFKIDDVTKQACNDGLFALVGNGAVQDQQGVSTREGCGLPEVAAYSATPERSTSKDFFQPIPGTQPKPFNIGPCKYRKSKDPSAAKKAAVVYTNFGAAKSRGLAIKEACTKAGYDFVVDEGITFGEKNFTPLVDQLKSKGVQYFTIVSVVPDTAAILREMKNQNYRPKVIDLGQQYYDPAMAAEPAADGAYVLTNTVPFEEVSKSPGLQVYEKWLEKQKGEKTSLGVQAWSASLLFATALKGIGNDITRENLVKQLKTIHKWDGGGVQMTTDPGGNVHNSCFLYLKITGGKFVREYPKEGFSCNKSDVITLSRAYLTAS